MKIVLCEFHQESNSFNPEIVGREAFEYYGIYLGEEMRNSLKNKPSRAIAAMFDAIEEVQGEAIPACSMYSQSGGKIDHSVLEWFLDKTITIIKDNLPLDGVFVSLHGATQTTKCDDVSGFILENIRKEIGDKPVISASFDLHANITNRVVKNTNFICGYQTYPHTDYYETGYRAARLGIDSLMGKKKNHLVRVAIPMIIPANGYTTLEGPFAELINYSKSLIESKELVDFSIFMMQPWLDVEEGATSVITIADDKDIAREYAVEIGERLYKLRNELQPQMYSIDEVINLAEDEKVKKPVILVDCADSSNAGAAGDGVAVIKRILERKSSVKTASPLTDAPAVLKAKEIGVGNKGVFSLGGTKDPLHNESIKVEAVVKSLHNGIFTQEGPAGQGIVINIGPTAVLNINGNIDIVVCHYLSGNGDPQLYRAFGIEPSLYELVVVKACTSFRAAYQLFADVICPTNTPGAASADLLSLEYKKLPKTFYPFSSLDDYQITDVSYGRDTTMI